MLCEQFCNSTIFTRMTTLAEIEAATDSLCPEEQQELFLFLVAKLRAAGCPASPREFEPMQIREWIADDEKGMQSLRDAG